MASYSKDLCIITFDERSSLGAVKKRVLNAFLEGIMCFQFRFQFKKPGGKPRQFEDRVALPKDADERVALEMAEDQFQKFLNTVTRLIRS